MSTDVVARSVCPASLTVVDSITDVIGDASQTVVVTGSHGGDYPARLALMMGARAAVFNDASFGKDDAGVAGLDLLASCDVPAASVDYRSAAIGVGQETLSRGTISRSNDAASALGVRVGMGCREAADLLTLAPVGRPRRLAARSARWPIPVAGVRVWALDSAALITPEDDGCIVATGSHGGLPGRKASRAVRARLRFVIFNDAGGGSGGAGFGRLAVLGRQGIAGATVSAVSARIGDGRSTYADGVLSAVNSVAEGLDVHPGMRATTAVGRVAALPIDAEAD